MSRVDVGDVVRAKSGDRAAFDRLAESVVDRLLQVARLILRDGELAEDAAQDALIRCWRDLPSLRDPDAFDAWLNRLLIRAVQEQFRLQRRHRAAVTVLHLEPGRPDASEDIATREQLARGFKRLTLEHRSVLLLRLYLGLKSSNSRRIRGWLAARSQPTEEGRAAATWPRLTPSSSPLLPSGLAPAP